jgi:hypothetical protein
VVGQEHEAQELLAHNRGHHIMVLHFYTRGRKEPETEYKNN